MRMKNPHPQPQCLTDPSVTMLHPKDRLVVTNETTTVMVVLEGSHLTNLDSLLDRLKAVEERFDGLEDDLARFNEWQLNEEERIARGI